MFLRLANDIVVGLTADRTLSSHCVFDRKNVPLYNMLTVTTDPDLNRNELFRTPLRANYLGMKWLGLARTALEADSPVSEPNSKTRRWATRFSGVLVFRYLLTKRWTDPLK